MSNFETRNAPSEAQSVDVERWKEKRNKEMGSLPTCEMFDEVGRKCVVNVKDVEMLKEQGYREIDEVGKAKDAPLASDTPSKSEPKPETKPTKVKPN